MSWTNNYWDIVNEFYWVPSYLGLKSIPQKYWEVGEETVTIPREMTNPSGPLYRRLRSSREYWRFVRRQEETFNHIFNLTLSVLPGDVISTLFRELIGDSASHNYQLRGHFNSDVYPWIDGANVTSPDSFLLSEESILAIEIKFTAKTSLDQLAKYVALIAGEEVYGSKHENLHLLYIYPSRAFGRFLKESSIDPYELGVEQFDLLEKAVRNSRVKKLFALERDAIIDVLSRLHISCITWLDFQKQLVSYMEELGDSAGERTLLRLLKGLDSEIQKHPLSGVPNLTEQAEHA